MPTAILVIDDDPILREVASAILEEAGYLVHTACDGMEGLEVLGAVKCDLVICDVFMPRMDGIETVRAISDRWPQLPVLMLTAGSTHQPPATVLRTTTLLGARHGLSKPISAAKLLPVVRDLLAPPAAPIVDLTSQDVRRASLP